MGSRNNIWMTPATRHAIFSLHWSTLATLPGILHGRCQRLCVFRAGWRPTPDGCEQPMSPTKCHLRPFVTMATSSTHNLRVLHSSSGPIFWDCRIPVAFRGCCPFFVFVSFFCFRERRLVGSLIDGEASAFAPSPESPKKQAG